jgi:hypothetical protein
MSLSRAVVSVAAIFLGLSAAVAAETNNTSPPLFQGLMVDAKGKDVGRVYPYMSVNFGRATNKQYLGTGYRE